MDCTAVILRRAPLLVVDCLLALHIGWVIVPQVRIERGLAMLKPLSLRFCW